MLMGLEAVTKNYDNTAEANILGGICLYYEDLNYVFSDLSASEFEDERLASIYRIIKKMHINNEKIDIALVRNKLDENQSVLLAKCAEIFISKSNYNDYIQAVKIGARTRRLRKGVENIYITETDGNAILQRLREIVSDEEKKINDISYDDHSANQYLDYVNSKQRIANGEKPKVCRTGLSKIDKCTGGGLRMSSVSCIGALPSTGKTDLMIQIGVRNILDGKKVVMFTLEMSQNQFLDRVVAQIADIPYSKLTSNEINDKDVGRISVALSQIYQNKPLIFPQYNTIEAIEKIINDTKPDIVLIDYLQIINIQKRIGERRHEIEYIGNVFKRTAKDNDCQIMFLSQLSRVRDRFPTMQDLKESGSIEQQCDLIMLMHRPYVVDKNATDGDGNPISPKQTYLLVDKNKFGECGQVELVFDGERQMFFEMTDNFE